MRYHNKAFTLLELLLVIIVLAALMALFIPQLNKFKEKFIDAEAYNMIGTIARAEDAYYGQYGSYITCSTSPIDASWKQLSLENPNTPTPVDELPSMTGRYFDYRVETTGNGSHYVVLATRRGIFPARGFYLTSTEREIKDIYITPLPMPIIPSFPPRKES